MKLNYKLQCPKLQTKHKYNVPNYKQKNGTIIYDVIGTVEFLLYGYKAGMDRDSIIDIIGKGAAASWSINNLGRRMVKGNFFGFVILNILICIL